MNAHTNLPFSYSIRRSSRSTRLRILVSANKVEAVAPPKLAEQKIHQFVVAKQAWITQALAKMAQKKAAQGTFTPAEFVNRTKIPYLGEYYLLRIEASALKRIKIDFTDSFVAYVPKDLVLGEHSNHLKAALQAWMKKQALLQVKQLVVKHASLQQLHPRSINIRTQKSRWGSCGIHNDIQINCLLMLAPLEVLEYVVVHELCHIREKNHSHKFWELVAWHLPNYQVQRHWLKQNGSLLMAGL
jgi:predicted metal-dependent hydrolase